MVTKNQLHTIFVTGTDTEVGKTLIAQAIIKHFTLMDKQVAAMKPVASGATFDGQQWLNEDAQLLMSQMNTEHDYENVNPYVFEDPIAPHIAAWREDVRIEIETLNSRYALLAKNSDVVVVEGAGGWQVPLNEHHSIADWVTENRWPVVLVVGLRLGCLNHARLTYLDMLQKETPLLGWVANMLEPDVREPAKMIEDLKSFIDAPLLGIVPPLSSDVVESVLDNLDLTLLSID